MSVADVPLGLRLSEQAEWNQTEADWRRFLALQADGCFVGEWEETAVATTMAFVFGDVGWIAMVLVEASMRGRGVGTALLQHAVRFLEDRGALSIRLDATRMGLPLYRRLGFVEQFQLARYAGQAWATAPTDTVTVAPPEDWEALAALDRRHTRTDRARLLMRQFAEPPAETRQVCGAGGHRGFVTVRPGRRAVQIGPCIGMPDAGAALLADALHRYAGQQVFLDVPVANVPAVRLVEAHGLVVQRHFTRMCRGNACCEDLHYLWASSGPEKG